MLIKQKKNELPKIRIHPLQRSESVTAIIHGDQSEKSNHYVDALQRFKRDYASIDKEERTQKREKKLKDDERRRNYTILRDQSIKHYEDQNLNKLLNMQKNSQLLHDLGAKRTAHTHSIPVNPINQNYQNNQRGKRQAHNDQLNKINKLVRSHHLQTCGNSGYNIINGKPSLQVDYSLPSPSQEQFQQKLSRYYSQFKLDPTQK